MGHEFSAGVGQANRAGDGRRLYPIEKRPLPAIFLFPEPLRPIRILRSESHADALYGRFESDVLVEEINAGSRITARPFPAAGHCAFQSFRNIASSLSAIRNIRICFPPA